MKRASVDIGIAGLIVFKKGSLVNSRDYYIKTDAAGKHFSRWKRTVKEKELFEIILIVLRNF